MDPKRLFRTVDNEDPRVFLNARAFRFGTSKMANVASRRELSPLSSLGAVRCRGEVSR